MKYFPTKDEQIEQLRKFSFEFWDILEKYNLLFYPINFLIPIDSSHSIPVILCNFTSSDNFDISMNAARFYLGGEEIVVKFR